MVEKTFDFIGKWIIVALGVIASLGAFVNMFDVPMYMPVMILMSILFAGIFLGISKTGKKCKIIFHILLVVILVATIVILRKQLIVGIYSISNSIIDVYNKYFGGDIGFFKIKRSLSYHDVKRYTTIAAVIVTAIDCLILVTATWYKLFASIHILLSLCFVLPGLVLGKVPNSFFVSLLMIYYMTCFMYQHSKVIYPARFMALVLMSVCIIGLIYLVCPPDSYDGENRYKGANKKLNYLAGKFSLDSFSKGNFGSLFEGNGSKKQNVQGDLAIGGINGGRLGSVDSVMFFGTVMLNVGMMPDHNNIYLKGFVGTDYKGTRWRAASDDMDWKLKELYAIYNADTPEKQDAARKNVFLSGYENYVSEIDKKMTIAYENDPGIYRYYPYFSDIAVNEDVELFYALRPKRTADLRDSHYEYTFTGMAENELYQKYSLANESTDIYGYIKSTNLSVPENLQNLFMTIPGLEKDCYDETPQKLAECIDTVRQFLKRNTEYSLEPGKLTGTDFVEDFLLYKKKGYCTAYASSAVLMLRYMGVPARYVEGYVIQPSEYKAQEYIAPSSEYREQEMDSSVYDYNYVNLQIKDHCAHAWVEVYVPGLGFVPIEVTPGYMEDNQTPQNPSTEHNEPESKREDQETTVAGQETTKKQEKSSETATDENGNTESSKIGGNAVSRGTNNGSGETSYMVIILIMAGILILLAISLFLYKMAERKKKVNDYNTDDNRKNMRILIKIFEECLKKTKIEFSMNVNSSMVEEAIGANVDHALEKIKGNKHSARKENVQMVKQLDELREVKEVLELIYRYKYDSESAEFTNDEVDTVRQYVEKMDALTKMRV